MGESITHCGPLGAGVMVKLVNNYISAVVNLATAEGLALAEAAARASNDDAVAALGTRRTSSQVSSQGHCPCGKALGIEPAIKVRRP